jgi:anhydro-N-acetylmuramic acid kinase
MVLDELARRFTGGAETFDRDGRFAAGGTVDGALLAELLADPVLASPPPRVARPRAVRAPLRRPPPGAPAAAWPAGLARPLATAAELTARAVRDAHARFVAPVADLAVGEVVASGGGVRNPELMRRLAATFAPVPVVPSDDRGLPADSKEAIAFAMLASARVDGVPGTCRRSPAPAGPCCWARSRSAEADGLTYP